MPGPAKGVFYYLYLILDLYSRKVVGWEIHGEESSVLASQLLRRAYLREGIAGLPLVLHSDNGSPMKGASLTETLRTPPAVLPNLGGSIPNDVFTDLLGMPTIWVPHSYAGCSQHAPNEHLLLPIAR